MAEQTSCLICDRQAGFQWTDTHGVGQCSSCGAPYRLYHYDGANQRIDKPAEFILFPELIPLLRQFIAESPGRCIHAGCSFPGGYEKASNSQANEYYEWLDAHGAKEICEVARAKRGELVGQE